MSPCKECGHKAGLHDAACQSAPSPQPEIRIEIDPCYGDGAYWVSVSALHKALATQGLTIVGPAERAVLEACEALEEYDLKYWVVRPKSSGKRANLAEAELARRAAKEGT